MDFAAAAAAEKLQHQYTSDLADWQGTVRNGVYPNIARCLEVSAAMREALSEGGKYASLADRPLAQALLGLPEIAEILADLEAVKAKIEAIDGTYGGNLFEITQPEV